MITEYNEEDELFSSYFGRAIKSPNTIFESLLNQAKFAQELAWGRGSTPDYAQKFFKKAGTKGKEIWDTQTAFIEMLIMMKMRVPTLPDIPSFNAKFISVHSGSGRIFISDVPMPVEIKTEHTQHISMETDEEAEAKILEDADTLQLEILNINNLEREIVEEPEPVFPEGHLPPTKGGGL